MQKTAKYWIEKFSLTKHPEGGYFKEIYRSEEIIQKQHLPLRFSGDRNFSTSIYFLLDKSDFSSFHKIKSDEQWHFYAGNSLSIFVISPSGDMKTILLGDNPDKGEMFTAIIKKDYWFAAKPNDENSFSLVGCTVAPGFDFKDFTLGKHDDLLKEFPQHSKVIFEMTRQK